MKAISDKFIDSIDITDYEVLTDTGFQSITHIHKTKKFFIWTIKTKSFELKCADEHIIIGENYKNIYVKDLSVGDKLMTKNGLEEILSIDESQTEVNMYDVTVDSPEHTLYTNGILSHNTTIARIFIAHYILFNADKNVAILADKEKTALKILRDIKNAYKELPIWLQQGVLVDGWNALSIRLENGTSVMASSTASTAMRGESISLLYLDEFAFVPKNIADDFMASVYPTISSGKTSKIIAVSTPNGLNHFYNLWRSSIRNENGFKAIKINWNEIPGRDEVWKDSVIKDIGIIRWNAEFGCSQGGGRSYIYLKNSTTGELKKVLIEDLYEGKLENYIQN